MAASVRAGRVLELESQPTLSDGTAGGIEPDAITFALCRAAVAALRRCGAALRGQRVAVLCGGNVSAERMRGVL